MFWFHRVRCLCQCLLSSLLAFLPVTGGTSEPTFLVRSWQSEEGLPSNNIRSLAQAADGYLWIATAEGVVSFDGVRFSSSAWEQAVRQDSLPPAAIFALKNGDLWIATTRGELWKWANNQMQGIWQDTGDARADRRVKNIISDGPHEVWIECSDGLYLVRGNEQPVMVETAPDALKTKKPPTSVMAETGEPLELTDQQGRRWRKTERGSLAVSAPGGTEQILREFSEGIVIVALLEDREGNVWVGTNGSGMFQIKPRRVQVMDTADGIADRKVRALMEDRTGALWAANRNSSIDRIQPGGVEPFQLGDPAKARPVSSICEDRDGVIWVGMENGSILRQTKDGFELITGEKPWMRRLEAMLADQSGGLWLGGGDGLAFWRSGQVQSFGAEYGLPSLPVTALAFGVDHSLYLSMTRGAVYRRQDGRFEKIGSAAGSAVSALLPEKTGSVWATTLGDGLFLYENGRQTQFSVDAALPDARLTCVLDDGNGFLWLGSLAGIFRVSKWELLEIAAGRREQANWLHLDRADGMISRECTGAFQPAGWRGRDGTLWFPTVHGIASIQPKSFALNQVPPQMSIEKIAANGRGGVIHESGLTTGPGRTRLEFHYTALSFTAPEKVRFRTRLEGLQTEWQEAGTQRSVSYEAVPPGDYVFHVLAANNDGVWSAEKASLAVRVLPHFWETSWFQSMAVSTVLALSFGVGMMIARARSRMRLLRLEAQTAHLIERERIAQDLHDDLGASLTEISLLAGLAAEDANTAKIPTIAAKAQQLVSTLDEIVWAVNPRHDTLASFVEYLTASAAELLDAGGIALRLEIAETLPDVQIDSVQRHALFLAAREALNNAMKHSGAREVRLGIEFRASELVITIKDNGQGFSAEASSQSEGLRNMQARLTGIGGTCQIESATGGTLLKFTLRLDEKK